MNDLIHESDSLEYLKTKQDFEFDINFSDVPYALGSEVIIQKNGKPEYKKAIDFMNKWKMPTGKYWEEWFTESFRTLKHGGYCLVYGIDRQLLMFKYYASMAGFIEQQSLYWYFISNMPKTRDLSKMIDKHLKYEREVVGIGKFNGFGKKNKELGFRPNNYDNKILSCEPLSEFGKKYDGYKYSIAPLKQTNETIMVFQKPYKTGSCLHDTLAYEDGDETCCCSALDIGSNKVVNGDYDVTKGRFPAQAFINSDTAKVLDKQSGISKGGGAIKKHQQNNKSELNFTNGNHSGFEGFDDIGGCSKILHKCDYMKGEMDLYLYEPKVSQFERNFGVSLNNHPTLKPINLNYRILSLFKTPNKQKIIYPFAGVGSEIIGGLKAGFCDYCACELSEEYIDIAKQRIKYWLSVNFNMNIAKNMKYEQNLNSESILDLF